MENYNGIDGERKARFLERNVKEPTLAPFFLTDTPFVVFFRVFTRSTARSPVFQNGVVSAAQGEPRAGPGL
jgi:hypothetical protein